MKAAEAGVVYAQLNVGKFCYYQGKGVAKDHAEAYKWLNKPADLGSFGAHRALGKVMALGDGGEQDLNGGLVKKYRQRPQRATKAPRLTWCN